LGQFGLEKQVFLVRRRFSTPIFEGQNTKFLHLVSVSDAVVSAVPNSTHTCKDKAVAETRHDA
jgi:hypothetical protein